MKKSEHGNMSPLKLEKNYFFRSGDDYDNCLLSDESYGTIDTYNQLDYDLSWNVYILSDGQNCLNTNYANSEYILDCVSYLGTKIFSKKRNK